MRWQEKGERGNDRIISTGNSLAEVVNPDECRHKATGRDFLQSLEVLPIKPLPMVYFRSIK
jgi:hypothetical protein